MQSESFISTLIWFGVRHIGRIARRMLVMHLELTLEVFIFFISLQASHDRSSTGKIDRIRSEKIEIRLIAGL